MSSRLDCRARGTKQSDHCRVDTAHHGSCACAPAQRVPEGQRADEDQQARKKNADQAECGAHHPVWRSTQDGAKIGGERKERSGYSLRGTLAGKEEVVAHPAGRHERLAQQRQHDMTFPKNERAGPVERFEQGNARP